jgi:hypothetical protein
LVAAAGASTSVRASAWPALGARYERRADVATGSSDRDIWDALERGEDPTLR